MEIYIYIGQIKQDLVRCLKQIRPLGFGNKEQGNFLDCIWWNHKTPRVNNLSMIEYALGIHSESIQHETNYKVSYYM